jgi:hypothetical protein
MFSDYPIGMDGVCFRYVSASHVSEKHYHRKRAFASPSVAGFPYKSKMLVPVKRNRVHNRDAEQNRNSSPVHHYIISTRQW